LSEIQKILAIKLRAIGDTVIWTSALSALRQAEPDAEIHVLTYASNLAVLQSHPSVDRVHLLQGKGRVELLRALFRLRQESFDWVLGFHATTSLCRWAWLARGKRLALHHHSWTYSPCGSAPVPSPGHLEDAVSRDYRVLEAMGLAIRRAPTSLHFTVLESEWAEETMREGIRVAGGNEGKPRRIFLPGAGHVLRRYPKDLLLPVIESTAKEGHVQPVVIADLALSEEWGLAAECRRLGVPLFDKFSLRQFTALVSRGQTALANDSGPGHIAVAAGLKTTFLFGPGCVGDWHCYDPAVHPVLRVEVPCRLQGPRDQKLFQFCTAERCDHHTCMRGIGRIEMR
jgi:ADP-heptose:LPS heptosyltransferase